MEILLQSRCFLLPYHNPATRQYNHSLFPPPMRKNSTNSTVLQQLRPISSLTVYFFFYFKSPRDNLLGAERTGRIQQK